MARRVNIVRVFTSFADGISPQEAVIEVSIVQGLPTFDVIGLCDSSIRESRGRIQPALIASGFQMPKGHITASISPAFMKKSGTSFDLPIAIGMLVASGQLSVNPGSRIYATGEISLDGLIRATPLSPLRMKIAGGNYDYVFIPEGEVNGARCAGVRAMTVKRLSDLRAVFEQGDYRPLSFNLDDVEYDDCAVRDFSVLKGQSKAARTLLIAASGFHNVLLLGSPGCGKTMAGRLLAGIMPPLEGSEIGDVFSAMEAYGIGDEHGKESLCLGKSRPFRYIYPGMNRSRILGSAVKLIPGEFALANHGVLFADEIFEYSREILEAMRVPLEDRVVRMSKDGRNYAFPASFVFIAAGNPCKCGMLYESGKRCTCTPRVRSTYLSKLSGPMRDRIDLVTEMRSVSGEELKESMNSENDDISSSMRSRVKSCWDRQKERYGERGIFNGTNETVDAEILKASREVVDYASSLTETYGLSARGFNRVMRVGRTIADLEDRDYMICDDVAEAAIYRKKDW